MNQFNQSIRTYVRIQWINSINQSGLKYMHVDQESCRRSMVNLIGGRRTRHLLAQPFLSKDKKKQLAIHVDTSISPDTQIFQEGLSQALHVYLQSKISIPPAHSIFPPPLVHGHLPSILIWSFQHGIDYRAGSPRIRLLYPELDS